MKLVIATSNAHKLAEIQHLLAEVPDLELLSLRDFAPIDEPDETGATMQENAHLKAQYYARHTQLPTLADDSGLEVSILNNAPGVHSARWVEGNDADRTQALLKKLGDNPNREARYRCALCLFDPAASTCNELEATCEGRIATKTRGENGFGYDPIFEITSQTGAPGWLGQTMAQVPPNVKAQISHRARAVKAMAPRLGEKR